MQNLLAQPGSGASAMTAAPGQIQRAYRHKNRNQGRECIDINHRTASGKLPPLPLPLGSA